MDLKAQRVFYLEDGIISNIFVAAARSAPFAPPISNGEQANPEGRPSCQRRSAGESSLLSPTTAS